jgi:hypothetical protein
MNTSSQIPSKAPLQPTGCLGLPKKLTLFIAKFRAARCLEWYSMSPYPIMNGFSQRWSSTATSSAFSKSSLMTSSAAESNQSSSEMSGDQLRLSEEPRLSPNPSSNKGLGPGSSKDSLVDSVPLPLKPPWKLVVNKRSAPVCSNFNGRDWQIPPIKVMTSASNRESRKRIETSHRSPVPMLTGITTHNPRSS